MKSEFGERLSYLRMQKGVSARSMSLSLGQNLGYINNIENKRAFPSMEIFFNICEFLEITPQEFFDEENINPEELNAAVDNLKKLDAHSLESISTVIELLAKK
ncbi:MAG: helix-turn-helix domain-containing protein [Defluviitaleaceae bacterium]|nr:helix-turn-helix domain-containing protein [Defluviitaleaceae bacterium]